MTVSLVPAESDAVAGATVTVVTAPAVTVTDALPLFPSLVAVMVATPGATPVTRPEPSTVAADELLDHVTGRPRSIECASNVATLSCVVAPPSCKLALDGLTTTDTTGACVTVTVAVPVCPSLVAVIVAVPAATAVTRPDCASTVATDELFVDHPTTRPVKVVPEAFLVVAESATVWYTAIDGLAGLTTTLATGFVTVTVILPLFPSLVAVIVAVPRSTELTTPVAETVATDAALEDQVTARPVRVTPCASLIVAVIVADAGTCKFAVVGDRRTVSTGAGVTVKLAMPDLPSLVAVIVAVPVAMAVTRPVASTLATNASLVDHVMARPVSVAPDPSLAVANSLIV